MTYNLESKIKLTVARHLKAYVPGRKNKKKKEN